jgi:hypothetical protein
MIPLYVHAMRVPEWRYNDDDDDLGYSLAGEASVALAAVGRDSVPVIVGLLYDEDPRVRGLAADALSCLAYARNGMVTPLPKEQLQFCLPAVNDVLARELDPDVAATLRHVLRKLSEVPMPDR